jgi:universal stress protein family protein
VTELTVRSTSGSVWMPPRGQMRRWWRVGVLPTAALLGIAAGLIVQLATANALWSQRLWMLGLIVTGAPVVWQSLRGLMAGQFASDLVATLAILTAAVLGQPFPGLVIVLMRSGGEALELADRVRADVVAVGRQHHSVVSRLLLPSVATDLLRDARYSVLATASAPWSPRPRA